MFSYLIIIIVFGLFASVCIIRATVDLEHFLAFVFPVSETSGRLGSSHKSSAHVGVAPQ